MGFSLKLKGLVSVMSKNTALCSRLKLPEFGKGNLHPDKKFILQEIFKYLKFLHSPKEAIKLHQNKS